MRKLALVMRDAMAVFGVVAMVAVGSSSAGFTAGLGRWLSEWEYRGDCDYILVLPGGAIPSPAMFMRAYRAAEEFKKNPRARVVISHKSDPPLDSSAIWGIRRELMLRGVPAESIILETKATSTYEHAKYIFEAHIGDPANDRYLIVTSPYHVRRSAMVFKAKGFAKVYAAPAVGEREKEDLGAFQEIRYDIWGRLMSDIENLRELAALGFYFVTGRI
jgi:uncharacterized SAM-binding protein YcdF (DUF218 family)